MAVKLPLSAYLGVALLLMRGEGARETLAVSLEHRDPGLCVPLYTAGDDEDVVAEWQLWARVLGRPLLLAAADGTLQEPFRQLGVLKLGAVAPRRRRRNAIKRRRPSILMRRRPGFDTSRRVHRDEREIVARN